MKNMLIAGYVAAHIGISKEILEETIVSKLASRGDELLKANLAAENAGFNLAPKIAKITSQKARTNKIILSGNEAIVLGAIAAGCRFYSGYPITPASDILDSMASLLPGFGGAIFQGEDEIASLGAAIGSSFAGTKSMVATSGPGFSLMSEMIGLASMVEIPVVIIERREEDPQRVCQLGPSSQISITPCTAGMEIFRG